MNKIYNIAKEFTPFPAGRTKDEGDYSGEAFRSILKEELKKLNNGDILTIDLNGLRMTGSSFLEEAFGGLIRKEICTVDDLKAKLKFISDREILTKEIWYYISRAADLISDQQTSK